MVVAVRANVGVFELAELPEAWIGKFGELAGA